MQISIHSLSLINTDQNGFEDFTMTCALGSRIAIIGRNGAGKSSILKALANQPNQTTGQVCIPSDARLEFIPQVLTEPADLSGGQRFMQRLAEALSRDPDILLLDEPSNHLDREQRQHMLRCLKLYRGTLIVATHDSALCRLFTTFWHIAHHNIHVFHGEYAAYLAAREQQQQSLTRQLHALNKDKKVLHNNLMHEQQRAAHSKAMGRKHIKQRKWPTIVSNAKSGRAQKTSGNKKAQIQQRKAEILDSLASLHQPEEIKPNFSIPHQQKTHRLLIDIHDGVVAHQQPIVKQIHFSLHATDRVAIIGQNGAGKSSVVKAIMDDPSITRYGQWVLPNRNHIGYLDQHYDNLAYELSVIDALRQQVDWTQDQLRSHLNDFLFRKNAAIHTQVTELSGGEKARLSLALIAARQPQVLILDELSNNLDLETKAHVSQVIRAYLGALICISHDDDFLDALGITMSYTIHQGIWQS